MGLFSMEFVAWLLEPWNALRLVVYGSVGTAIFVATFGLIADWIDAPLRRYVHSRCGIADALEDEGA